MQHEIRLSYFRSILDLYNFFSPNFSGACFCSFNIINATVIIRHQQIVQNCFSSFSPLNYNDNNVLCISPMENNESLEATTLVSQFSDSIQNFIDHFFAHCIMAAGIIVGCIFFSSYQLFWMVKLSVRSSSHLI